jgi:hypothetical protein
VESVLDPLGASSRDGLLPGRVEARRHPDGHRFVDIDGASTRE